MMSGEPVPRHKRVHDHIAAVAAAAAVGVERIVYLFFVSPAPDATFILAREHFHTEELATGEAAKVSDAVPALCGRPARVGRKPRLAYKAGLYLLWS
jgi:hypothetical protein